MNLSNEAKVGIFVVGALAMVIFGLQYISGSKYFGAPLTLYAKYANVEGLSRGNPITINGFQVGRITALDLNVKAGMATAKLEFDKDFEIPANSEAMIYSSDLLGSKAIKIWVPDSLAPTSELVQDGQLIKGTLDKGIFAEAEDLVTSQGAEILVEVAKLSVKLNEIVAQTQALLDDKSSQTTLRATLSNIRETSENLTSITDEVDSLAKEINRVARDAVSIVGNVEDNNDNINNIIANVTRTTDSLVTASSEVKDLMTDASSAVAHVENMIAKLDTTSGTLGMLLNDTQLYDSLTATTENVNALLREVRRNPGNFFDDFKIYLIERKKKEKRDKKKTEEQKITGPGG
ncbi:MAG: MlaD family protein [Bacteroidia bacterium]|nr:MlaD family protein [Bacteroidia bacterium]